MHSSTISPSALPRFASEPRIGPCFYHCPNPPACLHASFLNLTIPLVEPKYRVNPIAALFTFIPHNHHFAMPRSTFMKKSALSFAPYGFASIAQHNLFH